MKDIKDIEVKDEQTIKPKRKIDWIAFLIVTFAILCILKIAGVIGTSWWWISAPMILIGFILFVVIMTGLVVWIDNRKS